MSGSARPDVAFRAIPHVMKLRAGFANTIPEIVKTETDVLRQMGVDPVIKKDGFVELQPLSEAAALDEKKIGELILARKAARNAKNFPEADRIRDELNAMRIELEDHNDGTTTWKVRR